MTANERGPAVNEAPPESKRRVTADHCEPIPRHRSAAAAEHEHRIAPTAHPPLPLLPDAADLDLDVHVAIQDLLGWARTVQTAPRFGPREWLELPANDPRWKAALLLAGIAWWAAENGLGLPASPKRLHRLVGAELKVAALDVHAAVTEQGGFRRDHVAHAVLTRRRALAASRPEDHPGGSVPVWGPDDRRRVG